MKSESNTQTSSELMSAEMEKKAVTSSSSELVSSQTTSQTPNITSINTESSKERRNWLIHELFIQREFVDCYSLIEAQLRETEGMCEYALYVKGLLKRNEGKLLESLALFNTAALVNPNNIMLHKQVGRSLLLLGRYEMATQKFRDAVERCLHQALVQDWQLEFYIGLCYMKLREYTEAMKAFMRSMEVGRQEETFVELCKVLIAMNDYRTAIEVCEEGISFAPNCSELLTLAGQLCIYTQDTRRAQRYFALCLNHEPCNRKALVGMCSIIQTSGDIESAVSFYKVAIAASPLLLSSVELWANLGACYAAMKNYHSAIACLRKACFCAPLEWLPQYNLGILYLMLHRYVSAFQHLSCAISLNNSFPSAYMYLGTCLSFLNDTDNACAAYEKAIEMSPEPVFLLNYSIMLWNSALPEKALKLYSRFQQKWDNVAPELRQRWMEIYPTMTATMKECQDTINKL